jgi:hypothetical protein
VPLGALAAWVQAWTWVPSIFLPLSLLLLLFPDGRPLSPRWKRLTIASTGMLVLQMLAASVVDGGGRVRNPLALDEGDAKVIVGVSGVLLLLFIGVCLLSVASAFIRFRRAGRLQRQQMKWFAYAVVMNIGLQGTNVILWSDDDENSLFGVGLILLALAIGLAVLRYGLYEIDRIISRTLVYGLLTAGLASVYLALVVGLQALLQPLSGGSDLAIVVTTLVVAALFLPARRRVQRLVDRRFNRRAYDSQRTVDAFSARLREQIDLDALRYELLAVVADTMQPVSASLWLRRGESRLSRNDLGTP